MSGHTFLYVNKSILTSSSHNPSQEMCNITIYQNLSLSESKKIAMVAVNSVPYIFEDREWKNPRKKRDNIKSEH